MAKKARRRYGQRERRRMLEKLNLRFVGWEAYRPDLEGENALGMVDEAMPLLLRQ